MHRYSQWLIHNIIQWYSKLQHALDFPIQFIWLCFIVSTVNINLLVFMGWLLTCSNLMGYLSEFMVFMGPLRTYWFLPITLSNHSFHGISINLLDSPITSFKLLFSWVNYEHIDLYQWYILDIVFMVSLRTY